MLPVLRLPPSDTGLLQWSQNVVGLITPVPASWGLVVGDVTAYTVLHDSYSTCLAACDPSVRNKPAVVAKNQARSNLKLGAAVVANKIYASPLVSNSMKTEIGMPPRQTPAPIPPPAVAPGLDVLSVDAWTVRIRLHDATSSAQRGKTPGAIGASVFSFVGAVAPVDLGAWKFEGSTGLTKLDVTFANTLAGGTKVWLSAFWFNGRKQSGPPCTPVPATIQGGGVTMAA